MGSLMLQDHMCLSSSMGRTVFGMITSTLVKITHHIFRIQLVMLFFEISVKDKILCQQEVLHVIISWFVWFSM